jgi:hypothetical protein
MSYEAGVRQESASPSLQFVLLEMDDGNVFYMEVRLQRETQLLGDYLCNNIKLVSQLSCFSSRSCLSCICQAYIVCNNSIILLIL